MRNPTLLTGVYSYSSEEIDPERCYYLNSRKKYAEGRPSIYARPTRKSYEQLFALIKRARLFDKNFQLAENHRSSAEK